MVLALGVASNRGFSYWTEYFGPQRYRASIGRGAYVAHVFYDGPLSSAS